MTLRDGSYLAADYDVFEQRFANHLETLDDAAAVQFVAEFEQAAGFVILSGQNGLCSDKASCIQGVTSDVYFGRFGTTDLNAILDDLLN